MLGMLNPLWIFILMGSVLADSNLDLWLAAKDGNLYDVQDALSAGADPEWINPEDNWDEWTALHWAAQNNNPSIVIELLDSGAYRNEWVYINQGTRSRLNPLILASRAGHIETVNVLIGRGADVDWRKLGFTALISAALNNRLEVMDVLLGAGANIDSESNGATALYLASEKGNLDTVNKLIRHGADLNIQTWNGQMTALMIAAQEGMVDVVATLIEANADIELKSAEGFTALHFAAEYNQRKIAQLLLHAGADPDQQDDNGRTPRDIAKERGVTYRESNIFSVPIHPFPDFPVDQVVPEVPADAINPVDPSEQGTSTVTSDYAVYMLSGGVIISMATSLVLILT